MNHYCMKYGLQLLITKILIIFQLLHVFMCVQYNIIFKL